MPWEVCIRINGGRRKICFKIPQRIPKFRIPDPDPDPWIKSDILKEHLVKDIQILATIDSLASELSPGFKSKVQDITRNTDDLQKELPDDVMLNFGK